MKSDIKMYGLLKITGPDAKKFLQGQLTCDIEKINKNHFSLAAHCNPKGRDFYLLMQQSMLDVAFNALKKYVVFYKTTISIENIENSPVVALAEQCYQHSNAQPVPIIYPQTSDKFLAHELNLDELNAIAFDKGCYTGQEIIARMQYRGKVKNRLYHYKLNSSLLPAPGDDIFTHTDNRACGSVVNSWLDNNESHALIILHENNVHDETFFLKDNVPLTMQLISHTSKE